MTLTPPEAIAAGARWRLTDEAQNVWHDTTVYDPVSQTSNTALRARTGFHTLTFKDLYGWTKPQDRDVEVTSGGLTRAAGQYEPILRNLAIQCEGKGRILETPAAFSGTQYVLGTTVTLTDNPTPGGASRAGRRSESHLLPRPIRSNSSCWPTPPSRRTSRRSSR
jgi:hypothetical protein